MGKKTKFKIGQTVKVINSCCGFEVNTIGFIRGLNEEGHYIVYSSEEDEFYFYNDDNLILVKN